MVTVQVKPMREDLGDFSSIVCMKAIVTGVEKALGEKTAAIALIAAGRQRGKELAKLMDLTDNFTDNNLEKLTEIARSALGKNGTRLCIIEGINLENETYKVYAQETICSSGEKQGSSRKCTYTLGAIQGFIEAALGKKLRGRQVESVLRGSNFDVLEYTIII